MWLLEPVARLLIEEFEFQLEWRDAIPDANFAADVDAGDQLDLLSLHRFLPLGLEQDQFSVFVQTVRNFMLQSLGLRLASHDRLTNKVSVSRHLRILDQEH